MKIINITNGAFAALLLASSVAGAESQYPASDFQPKVVYQDPDYKHQSSSTSAPAAASAKQADSQYPAADFQPKVVYSDSEYKHSSAAPSSSASSSAEAAAPEAKKEESNFIYLIGLAVLGFVGFVFFKKQAQPEGHAAPAASRTAGGATGVAKYLNRKAGTGVSRYLEQQVKSVAASAPLTGVAKYMAGKTADNTSADKPASRVEQYLRNRG